MAGLPSDGCGWLIVERIADIALNSQWKAKGRELRRFVAVRKDLPARAISTKNKHLLAIHPIPARGFTAALSVFGGTPPPKPLKCKSLSNRLGARLRSRWANPTGGKPRLSCARFSFVSVDIIEMSPSFRSQIVHLSFNGHQTSLLQGNKKPCSRFGKQGERNRFLSSEPAYTKSIQTTFGLLPDRCQG